MARASTWKARKGLLDCSVCGDGVIGPDITGRPMCYGCGPAEMSPRCGVCNHLAAHHTGYGCTQGCDCMVTDTNLARDEWKERELRASAGEARRALGRTDGGG